MQVPGLGKPSQGSIAILRCRSGATGGGETAHSLFFLAPYRDRRVLFRSPSARDTVHSLQPQEEGSRRRGCRLPLELPRRYASFRPGYHLSAVALGTGSLNHSMAQGLARLSSKLARRCPPAMLRWALVLGLVTCADDAEDWSCARPGVLGRR